MRKMVAYALSAGLCVACSDPSSAPAPTASMLQPIGIYALSQGQPPAVPSAELLGKPFVDGFALRLLWRNVEKEEGVYDFSSVQSVLAALNAHGKKLTLQMLMTEAPDYVITDPTVQTYQVFTAVGTFVAPVPWNETALARYDALYQALSEFPVADAAQGGRMVPLRDHSALTIVPTWLMGMNGLRDTCQLSGKCPALHTLPGYTRDVFTQAVLRSVRTVVDRFPKQLHYTPVFRLSDATASPALDEYVVAALKQEFFPVRESARLGLFEENLSCQLPSSTAPLSAEKASTYIMFQMLQSWIMPFMNAAATDSCLVTTVAGDRTSAVSGPEVAIRYALETFGSRYVEVYQPDLLHAGFDDEFKEWHELLHATQAPK